MTAVAAPPRTGRRRTWLWVGIAMVVIVALALLTGLLTAPRPGGRMDAESTGSEGAHALAVLLRDQGVDIEIADTAVDAARLSGPDSLLLVAQTYYLWDEELLDTLAGAAGDLLLVAPTGRTREALAPGIETEPSESMNDEPNCDLREANRAGTARLGPTDTFTTAHDGDDIALTRCYDGALVRYRDGARTITVVGAADFMMNSGLLTEGNAALAMNLAGTHPRLVWYAPQRAEGEHSGAASITDLIPDRFNWMVWQLWLVVGLVAIWKGRRLGPLVAERLPVVVRASETVEGRGRLYRSRRSRDRAADALRTATIQRLTSRLGLGPNASPAAITAAITQNTAPRHGPVDTAALQHNLYGPPPATDSDLVHLAHALDSIERQVAQS